MNVRMLAVVMVSACTPTLTPVVGRQPLSSWTNPPRIVWLFDNSGSMLQPINPADAGCPAGCGTGGNPCPNTCMTRVSMFKAGMDTITAQLPVSTLHAATHFPTDQLCGPPTSMNLNLSVTSLHDFVWSLFPSGGSPTAAALRFVADVLPLPQTETLVVLVTDGLPNCNANNPYNLCNPPVDAAAMAVCRCTTSSCTGTLCSLGCLDDLGAVSVSHLLAERDMALMVIGVGAEIASTVARQVLGQMEISLPRVCTTNADCNGNPCGADGVCADKLFLVNSAAEFDAPTRRLAKAVQVAERCTWWLPRQVAASDLIVEIGADVIDPSQWSVKGDLEQRVVISGVACDRLIAGTESVSFSLPPSN